MSFKASVYNGWRPSSWFSPIPDYEWLLKVWQVSKINVLTHCWEDRFPNPKGYSRFYRKVYRIWRGPLTKGLCLDHTCLNKACHNPWHLEEVTYKVNNERARMQKKRLQAIQV